MGAGVLVDVGVTSRDDTSCEGCPGWSVDVDAGSGFGVVAAGAQETVKTINNKVARLRARCVMG